jgi:N6-adenosine-specific RNA methylase IME4
MMTALTTTDPNAPGLLSVERACVWLAQAVSVDEVKSLRDKAEAIAAYQRKQRAGRDAALDADKVVAFAERRIGELSRELPKAPGLRTDKPSPNVGRGCKSAALATHGISKQAASRYEAAAAMPEQEFSAAIEAEAARGKRITLRRIIEPLRRAARDAKLVEQSAPLPGVHGERCSVLLADPPWRYEHCEDEAGRAVEKQYPTMTLDAICARGVDADMCTEDAVLFLWATSPKLVEAMRVLSAWGFEYRTCMVWVKDKIGMGYYARQQHELLLIGVRGNVATPAPADRPSSVIEAPRGKHSAKPLVVYELIERMYPRLCKGEDFARTSRTGWLCRGNEL